MPTNVQVSFRFSVKITPSSGSPPYSTMTPEQKVAAKGELLASVEQEAVDEVVEGWSSVTIATDSCCEISDVVLREALQAQLDDAEDELAAALGFMPTLAGAPPSVVCTFDAIAQKHVCTRGFALLKGASGPSWTETSSTYELTAPIQIVAQWSTPPP